MVSFADIFFADSPPFFTRGCKNFPTVIYTFRFDRAFCLFRRNVKISIVSSVGFCLLWNWSFALPKDSSKLWFNPIAFIFNTTPVYLFIQTLIHLRLCTYIQNKFMKYIKTKPKLEFINRIGYCKLNKMKLFLWWFDFNSIYTVKDKVVKNVHIM